MAGNDNTPVTDKPGGHPSQGVEGWHRHSSSPGWVKSLFLESEFYVSPRKSFEIAHCAVAEAFTHFGIGEHEYFMSLLVRSGARNPLEVDFGCGRFLRKNHPGDIVFGGYQAGNSLKGVGPFESIGIYFPTNVIKEQFTQSTGEDIPDLSPLHSGVIRDEPLMFFLTQLLHESRRGQSSGHCLVIDGLFQSIIGRIATLGGMKEPLSLQHTKLSPRTVSRAIDYMQAHLGESIGLDELSAAAEVHKGHFARLFKKTVGETPMRFLSNLRIQKAKELLRNTQSPHTLEEIARQCGFANKSHFSNEFRRQTGVTPGTFRVSTLTSSAIRPFL